MREYEENVKYADLQILSNFKAYLKGTEISRKPLKCRI